MGTAFRHKRGLTTGGALHRNHRLWCQIQGGGKRRSGATSIDDNAVDDAIAGEADKRSPPGHEPLHTFARHCAPSNVVLCLSQEPGRIGSRYVTSNVKYQTKKH